MIHGISTLRPTTGERIHCLPEVPISAHFMGWLEANRSQMSAQKAEILLAWAAILPQVTDVCSKIPRNYTSILEAQNEELRQELRALRASIQLGSHEANSASVVPTSMPIPESVSASTETSVVNNSNSSHLQDLVNNLTTAANKPSQQQRFLGRSSGITLAKLVMAAVRADKLPTDIFSQQRVSYDASETTSTKDNESSLPPRHAADHLVEVYFQYRTPHLPIINRCQVQSALDGAYSYLNDGRTLDRAVESDVFTTYMVLAIALCDLPNPINPSSRSRPSESEGCFISAIQWVEKVISYSKSDLETLRAILLLAQYIALTPSRGSLWHLTGFALRLCIDIGLHWETEIQTAETDPDLLQERRRLWYATYQFDRVLSITLGRPFGINDDSSRVPLPSPWMKSRRTIGRSKDDDVHNQRCHNHMFMLSKLESEIRHVQQNQASAPRLATPKTHYSAWLLDIQSRLQEWYDTVPQVDKAHTNSIFAQRAYWDYLYNNATLLLFRPNSTVSHFPAEALSILFEASCKLIASIKLLQREGKCESLWKTVHHLFMAGVGVIYGLWHSKEIRDQSPLSNSISTLQSCASTLSAMAETFPGASGCRDVFDALSAAAVEFLVTQGTEDVRRNRDDFEKQVGQLLHKLQPTRNDAVWNEHMIDRFNLSTMLSVDGFAFGEMLSSAVQWPELQDMDFDELGPSMLTGIDVAAS
ncbi:Positive regulator of purine utilization [Pseudocercospora fuligena]|uniref:Positive regulator of purine utilization n=1 Tax=Pseudocercospora fuligena TaxID=685502 RepID=A0A8H6R935_9PEZI|nr:Positive regulator of purine utilization [Pseudocercospora fuligena]